MVHAPPAITAAPQLTVAVGLSTATSWPRVHDELRGLVPPVHSERAGRELERGDHRAAVDTRAARVEQCVADRAERRVHRARVVDGDGLEHVGMAPERDVGGRGEHLVVTFAETDPQRSADVVAGIGCSELGQRGHQRPVVLAGGSARSRNAGTAPPYVSGEQDAGARRRWPGPRRDDRRA